MAIMANRSSRERWCAQVLAQWMRDHPKPAPRAPTKPAKRPTKAPAKYNQKWDPAAIEAAQKAKRK